MKNFQEKSFIVSLSSDEFAEYEKTIDREKVFYIELDGEKIDTRYTLYKKFDEVIWFPDHFWKNWDVFWEVMNDRDYINKDIMVIITNRNMLLKNDFRELKIFNEILLDFIVSPRTETRYQTFIIK